MARRGSRRAPRAHRIRGPDLRAQVRGAGDDRSCRLRAHCPPVVAVLQPRALVRAPRRHRLDDRCGVRGKVCRPPLDCRRRDGQPGLRPCNSDPVCCARRLGGCEPPSRTRRSGRRRGCRRRVRMSTVDPAADRWHQRRRQVGFPLALDEDSRGSASRAKRRRTDSEPRRLLLRRRYQRNRSPPHPTRLPEQRCLRPQHQCGARNGLAFADPSATA